MTRTLAFNVDHPVVETLFATRPQDDLIAYVVGQLRGWGPGRVHGWGPGRLEVDGVFEGERYDIAIIDDDGAAA